MKKILIISLVTMMVLAGCGKEEKVVEKSVESVEIIENQDYTLDSLIEELEQQNGQQVQEDVLEETIENTKKLLDSKVEEGLIDSYSNTEGTFILKKENSPTIIYEIKVIK